MNHYIHNVPGRLRVKIPSIKKRPKQGQDIQKILDPIIGIDEVTVNNITGSVVVNYDSDTVAAREILDILKEKQYLREIGPISKDLLPVDNLSKAGTVLAKALFGWALGKALENTGLSFLAVFI